MAKAELLKVLSSALEYNDSENNILMLFERCQHPKAVGRTAPHCEVFSLELHQMLLGHNNLFCTSLQKDINVQLIPRLEEEKYTVFFPKSGALL